MKMLMFLSDASMRSGSGMNPFANAVQGWAMLPTHVPRLSQGLMGAQGGLAAPHCLKWTFCKLKKKKKKKGKGEGQQEEEV